MKKINILHNNSYKKYFKNMEYNKKIKLTIYNCINKQ